MPFFNLKKTQRYNISKKSDCIQTVQLLDETQIECTLTIESTGRECLENVLQRIEVAELEYFGLRYVTRTGQFLRWVDLDKPLKRQLQKHATADAHVVFLGVAHFVERAYTIDDDATRYQFFLQLRNDIADGKVVCSLEQAIMLASYCLQAEFGDYDYALQNSEYVREIENIDRMLLPRALAGSALEQGVLADVARHIVDGHMNLAGLTAGVAELQYLKIAEQLDGYGLEYYKAKSEQGADVFIGYSCVGVVTRRPDGHLLSYSKWSEIGNITYNKKQLGIEVASKKKSSTKFLVEDAGTSKYLWKVAMLQRQFHLQHEKLAQSSSKRGDEKYADGIIGQIPDLQRSTLQTDGRVLHENAVDVDFRRRHTGPASAGRSVLNGDGGESSTYSAGLAASRSDEERRSFPVRLATMTPVASGVTSMLTVASSPVKQSAAAAAPSGGQVASVRLAAALPNYRPTPDYDTVMKQKQQTAPLPPSPSPASSSGRQRTAAAAVAATMQPHSGQTTSSKYINGRFAKNPSLSASQPDVYAAVTMGASGTSEPLYANINEYKTKRRIINRSNSLIVHATYSQPDASPSSSLSSAAATAAMTHHPDDISQMLLRDYRPPPAYGEKFRSTPDLTSHLIAQPARTASVAANSFKIGGSARRSPDLLSYSRKGPAAAVPPLPSPAAIALRSSVSAGPVPALSQTQYKSFDNLVSIGDDEDYEGDYVNEARLGRRRHSQTSDDTFHEVQSDDESDTAGSYGCDTAEVAVLASAMNSLSPSATAKTLKSSSVVSAETVMPLVSKVQILRGSISGESRTVSAAAVAGSAAAVTGSAAVTATATVTATLTVTAPADLQSRSNRLEDRFPKDDRRHLLEVKLAERGVFAEYESIPKKRPKADCKVALQPECALLNRFPNVLPYEDTRVRLSPRDPRNKVGYINASRITVKVGGSAPAEECSYIATQNPLESTCDDFWQMVWEQNVHIVTMASGLEERGQMKCSHYWPDDVGAKSAVKFDEVLVTLQCTNAAPCFVTRCFKVKHLASGQTRSVWHIQYVDWPESGCPANVIGFLGYLDEVNSVRLHVQAQTSVGRPIVVHCSAGVARTGVVILCDIMKKCLEYNQPVNVADILSQLRQQRMYMVQTSGQYIFCYQVLIEYLKGSRLI